jgi:hypothetical protein
MRGSSSARKHVDVLRRADVAERHGRVALHHPELGALRRRAAERRAVGFDVHRQDLAHGRTRVLARERLARRERRTLRQLAREPLIPRTDVLGRLAVYPFCDSA